MDYNIGFMLNLANQFSTKLSVMLYPIIFARDGLQNRVYAEFNQPTFQKYLPLYLLKALNYDIQLLCHRGIIILC